MVDFVKLYSDEDVKELRRQYNAYIKGESYEDFLFRQNCDLRIENNKLKEQLNEANELISFLFPLSMNKERALEITSEYMNKWGVK